MLNKHDIYLFRQGTHARLYEKLGCHLIEKKRVAGAHFAVWAPNAARVSVIGDWNGWDPEAHPLAARSDGSGIWQGFVPGVVRGQGYKYHVVSNFGGYQAEKADPFAFSAELPPKSATRAWSLE